MSSKRHAVLQLLGALFAAVGATLCAALPVSAEDAKDFKVEGNISFATDYRFRGFTRTQEGPALQGGLDVAYRWLYVGVWGSNIDYGRVPDVSGRLHEAAEFETVFYGGVKHKVRGISLDFGASYYAYPGAFGFPQNLDYFEVKGGLSAEVHRALTAGLTAYYSPDYFGEVGRNWVFEGFLKRSLPKFAGLEPVLSGTIAYNAGQESKGGIDYWYWNAGISFIFAEYFELDLRYFDTIDVPSFIDCSHRCDGRFVARLTFEY